MRSAILAFLLGILICQQLPTLPTIQWIILSLIIAIGLGIGCLYAKNVSLLLRFIIFVIFGFIWMYWNAQSILAQQLPKEMEKKQLLLQGRIVNIPIQNTSYIQFDLQATHLIAQQSFPFYGKVRLKWYLSAEDKLPQVEFGQVWQFTVRLKRPHSTINFNVFDYSKHLFIQRIVATGNISKARDAQQKLLALPNNYQSFRSQFIKKIQSNIENLSHSGIILAIGLGHRYLISEQQWTLFRQTGTAHLVAISGLHVSSIAFIIFFISKIVWSFWWKLPLKFPSIYFATIMSLFVIFLYVWLAGFSISAQRAFIMVCGFLIPNFFNRNLSHSHRISLALAFVLIYDPLSTLTAGFWLSFSIVSIIIHFSQFLHFHKQLSLYKINKLNYLRLMIVYFIFFQLIISIINYPLSQYFFQDSNLFSVMLTNLFMIPLTTFVTLPLVFIGLLSYWISVDLSIWILSIVSIIFNYSFEIAKNILEIDQFIQSNLFNSLIININLFTVMLSVFSILIIFAPHGFSLRWLGLIGLLPLFINLPPANIMNYGEFKFTVLDVGQNLATVIETQNHQLMYDTANNWQAKTIIVPYLKIHKIKHLDLIIASHGDADHIGGVNNIAENMKIKQILTGETEISKIRHYLSVPIQQSVNVAKCRSGQKWRWDGVFFEILHPSSDYYKNNDKSCILKITGIKNNVLLTGDISELVEFNLLQKKVDLQADILIVPHHGSKTSSSFQFIRAVNPKIAIFSTGYLNHYNHPHPQILQRYQHAQTFNTPYTGAIHFSPHSGNFLQPILARETMQRIWHLR